MSAEIIPTIKRLSETKPSESITMLIYGDAGMGKTHFIGSAGSRTLIIDNGGGLSTLQSPGYKKLYPNVDPIVIPILEKVGLQGAVNESVVHDATCDAIDYMLDKHGDDFDTIAIDDASMMQAGIMNKALNFNRAIGKHSIGQGFVDKFKMDSPEVGDYSTAMDIMQQFLADYVRIAKMHNKHLIMAAHVRVSYAVRKKMNDELVVKAKVPFFTGTDKAPSIASKHFDMCWFFDVADLGGTKGRVHYAMTQPTGIIHAKTRWDGVYAAKEVNPNFLEIAKRMRESIK